MMELIGVVAVVVVLLVAGLAIAFDKGMIGLTPERIKALHDKGDQLQAKLEERVAKKVKPIIAKDKATRIADNAALLASGTITQADFDAAKAKILAE